MQENLDKIIGIKSKILSVTDRDKINEEQTKQALILPLFISLGYDIFNMSEFIPEYTADFGTKQGEKVDYAICINGQPLIIIEAKKLGLSLGKDQVSQLFRYYSITDAKIAILTNGDDYWFFTDSIKANQMDSEPYLKLKLSELEETDLETFEKYTRRNVENIDVASDVKIEKCKNFISEFIDGIYTGNLTRSFIEWIIDQSGTDGIEKAKVAALFDDKITLKFNLNRKIAPVEQDKCTKQEKAKRTWDKSKASDIVIGKEYVFNEVDWKFHKIEYLRLFNIKYEAKHYSDAGVIVAKVLCKKYKEAEEKFKEIPCIAFREAPDTWRNPKSIEGTNLIIETGVNSEVIRKTIEKMLDIMGIEHQELKICFEK